MDIEATADFHDWEVLPDSTDAASLQNTSSLDGIEGDSEGLIRSDYFSLDSHSKYAPTQGEDVTDDVSVESDNPSWIDPVCETRYTVNKAMGEFWSSDGSDDGKYTEFEAKNSEPDIVETSQMQAGSGSDVGGAAESGTSMELLSASGEIEAQQRNHEKLDVGQGETEAKIVEGRSQGENEGVGIEATKSGGEERIDGPIWWKLPLDLLKYCLFKASPVWTLSLAAAMVGVLVLGRRLYKMKRRSRTLQLKVTLDDKKVSQVMSRAARLNEAFSVVRLVPMIRPTLPAAGVAPYP